MSRTKKAKTESDIITGFWYRISFITFIPLVVVTGSILYKTGFELNIQLTLAIIMDISVILLLVIIFRLLRLRIGEQAIIEKSRKQEELQRFRMNTLVNNLADGIITTDEKGIIRIYNAASLNILDTNNSLNNQFINDVLPLKDASGEEVNLYNVLKQNHKINSDEYYYHYEDETIRISLIASELQSSMSTTQETLDIEGGFILIIRDVTKQKDLEDERDEFISVVSHELRTPLAIAEGTLSNVEVMTTKNITDKKKFHDALSSAHDQVMFLSKMVNDLSTISRAERGVGDEPEDIDVRELMTSLYNEHLSSAKEAGLNLDLDLSHALGHIYESRLYVTELLQNLITNAIKYTKEGRVALSASQSRGTVTFSISDTGIGISKSDKAKIFDKFYRSEDYRTRETGGTGLGLFVVTKLARKLDTDIELKSRLNMGSTFSFKIRARKAKK